MTITQLKYILAVAEHQNFTIAAAHCAVTQPTLSMQIQKLEEALEVQIFNRSKKPISLTEIGEKIIVQAKIIVAESHRIGDIVDRQKGFVGGEFKIAIIPTVMPTLLPMFLKTFTKKYPEVQLKIEELHTEDCIKKLNDGHIDVAIAATPLENEDILEWPLYYEPFVGFVPSEHRLFANKTIDIELNDHDDHINLTIIDTGIGFENLKSNIKDIVNPYFTTKKNGTGLGLSIVNKIINDHNGNIEFISIIDGAKIKIIFKK